MMEFDPSTVGALISLLTRVGVTFRETIWNSEESQAPTHNDRKAAWELYVEMQTRITTQRFDPKYGDEKMALESVYSLFQTTREILLKRGPDCVVFAEIAIEILNQKVRPFTSKWHGKSREGAFENSNECDEFRTELESLQKILRAYAKTLAVLAGITDIKSLSDTEH